MERRGHDYFVRSEAERLQETNARLADSSFEPIWIACASAWSRSLRRNRGDEENHRGPEFTETHRENGVLAASLQSQFLIRISLTH